MDQSDYIALGLAVAFIVVVWYLQRRIRRASAKINAVYAITPEMVEPHRRLMQLVRVQPSGTWLYTEDGYRLRITRMKTRLEIYDIERLTPDTWMLVPGEQAVHESLIVSADCPPVYRRTRALYATETELNTVDEEPITNYPEFKEMMMPAMIVDADDLTELANQLEVARPRE